LRQKLCIDVIVEKVAQKCHLVSNVIFKKLPKEIAQFAKNTQSGHPGAE
jgi:hypothetical protein